MLASNVVRATTLAGSPHTWQFQVLWFLHFLTIPALLTLVLGLLVVAPAYEVSTCMQACPPAACFGACQPGLPALCRAGRAL